MNVTSFLEQPRSPDGPRAQERIFSRDFVLVCLTSFANMVGVYMMLSTLPLYVTQPLQGSEADVGIVMGISALAATAARPLSGKLIDRWGRRAVLIVGSAALALACFSYLAAATVAILLVVRVLQGISFAGTNTASNTLAGDMAPSRRRGEALGYFGMFTNLALALAPWAALQVVHQFGFTAMFLGGGVVGLVAVLLTLGVRETRRGPSLQQRGPAWGLLNSSALRPSAVVLCFAAGYSALVSFLPLYASLKGLGDPGLFFTIYAGVLIVTRGAAGRLSDRLGRGAAILPGLLLTTIAMLMLSAATSMVWLIAIAIVYGASFALVFPALMALVVDVTHPSERGSAIATYAMAMDLGIGLGAFLWGFVAEHLGYSALYQMASLLGLLGIAAYLWLVRGKVQRCSDELLATNR